jgi:hypothetical protein
MPESAKWLCFGTHELFWRADQTLCPKLVLRSGSQWLQWSPPVFNDSAPTLAACPITFRKRPIPGGYSDQHSGGFDPPGPYGKQGRFPRQALSR